MRWVLLISNRINEVCRHTAVIFLGLMLLLVLFQVVARYIFQAVPAWTEQAARYFMIWGGLLGATVAFHGDKDPRLVQPPEHGAKIWIVASGWLRSIAVVIFLGPVLYHSGRFIQRGLNQDSRLFEIPMGYITAAIPLFIVIIFIHIAARLMGPRCADA